MLKGIHPLLGPDLLHALKTMGHGDDIVISDANFPSGSMGPPVIRADGVSATAMAEAILTHMPLDTFVPEAAWRMEVVGDPDAMPEVCTEFQQIVSKHAGDFRIVPVERFCFLRDGSQGHLHRRDDGIPAVRQPDFEKRRSPS